jgi:hypothetical protein
MPTSARPAKPKVWSPAYKDISEVPELEIRRLIEEVLAQAGGTDPKDLIRSVARRLGFERTGKNIEKWIGDVSRR